MMRRDNLRSDARSDSSQAAAMLSLIAPESSCAAVAPRWRRMATLANPGPLSSTGSEHETGERMPRQLISASEVGRRAEPTRSNRKKEKLGREWTARGVRRMLQILFLRCFLRGWREVAILELSLAVLVRSWSGAGYRIILVQFH